MRYTLRLAQSENYGIACGPISAFGENDHALIGMVLPNRTLPALLQAAKTNNTSTMIWAITGRNFGYYYTEMASTA